MRAQFPFRARAFSGRVRLNFTAKTVIAALVLITAACAFAYHNAADNGATNFDDHWQVTRNHLVQEATLDNVKSILARPHHGIYLPVKLLSYMADYAFYGALGVDPVKGVHLTNIILHALNSLLVALLCGLALGDLAGERLTRVGAAFVGVFSGVLFALHPIHVESVAWLSGRKDVLSFFFMMLSFLAFRTTLLKRSKLTGLASVLLFILALGSKSTVLCLPLLAVAYWMLLGRRGGATAVAVLLLLCFAALGAVFVGAAVLAGADYGARPVGGSYLTHLLTLLKTFPFYMRKLMFPTNLSVIYARPVARGFGDFGVWWGAALLAGQLAVAVFVRARMAKFIVLWYLLALLPVMQLIPMPVPALAADRYAYIPSVAFALAPALIAWNVRKALLRRSWTAVSTVLVGACVLYAGTLGVATWSRNRVWRSSETLWRDCLAKNPTSRTALLNLGVVYLEKDDLGAARELFEEVVRIEPGFILGYYQLGGIFERTGAPFLAKSVYSRVLSGESSHPERLTRRYRGLAANRLGHMALEEGRYQSALDHARQAMLHLVSPSRAGRMMQAAAMGEDALGPEIADSDVMKDSLVLSYRASQMMREARELADMLIVAGDAAAADGDALQAERHYRHAADSAEDYPRPRLKLARLYSEYARWTPAYEEFTAAFLCGAQGAQFEHDYGLAAIGTGRYEAAVKRLERALELNPAMVQAEVKLAYARAHLGETDKALAAVERVLERDPENENARRVKEIIMDMDSGGSDGSRGE